MKRKILLPILTLITTLGCSNARTPNPNVQHDQDSDEIKAAHFATLPTEIDFAGERVPLEYAHAREALQREMVAVMNMHSTTLLTLSRTTRYFPVIEPILAQYGIPNDFKYLAMTESSLDPNAMSAARAGGMWQFIPATAKDYGMETGDNIDMRYNVEIATHAACKYFKKAYARFGSWTMVAASYNMGMAGLSSRIDSQSGITNYYDLFMPEETMRYVFHIISYKIVAPDPSTYGFDLKADDYHKPFTNFKTIKVNDLDIDWSKVAAANGTNYRVLRILNPWIRSYSYKNPKQVEYTVAIPTGKFRELGY